MDGLAERAKTVNIIVSHVNIHEEMISVEDDFKNQVDRMTYQWIPVGLFSQQLLLLLSKFMNKVSIVAGMAVIHGFSNTDFNSPKRAGCSYLWVPSARSTDQ